MKEINLQLTGYKIELSYFLCGKITTVIKKYSLPDKKEIANMIKRKVGDTILRSWLKDPESHYSRCDVTIYETYNIKENPQDKDFEKRIGVYMYKVEEIIENIPELRLLYVTGQL